MNSQSAPQSSPSFTDRMRALFAPVITPIVSVMAQWGVSPNALTILGVIGHIAAAWLVANDGIRWAGIVLLVIAPLDAFDGALARKLKVTQGGFGAYLDSTLDRLAEIALFGGFLYLFSIRGDTLGGILTYTAISGSLMVSYARGRAEGLGFDGRVGFFGRLERYLFIIPMFILNLPLICMALLTLFTAITVGQRMVSVRQQALARLRQEQQAQVEAQGSHADDD